MNSPRPFSPLGSLDYTGNIRFTSIHLHEERFMSILREWRAEIRRATSAAYVEYVRTTGIAEYRRTPGNLGAVVAVRDIDETRSEIVTLSWWTSLDAIRAF